LAAKSALGLLSISVFGATNRYTAQLLCETHPVLTGRRFIFGLNSHELLNSGFTLVRTGQVERGKLGAMVSQVVFDVDFMLTPNPGETFATWEGLRAGTRSQIRTGEVVTASDGEVTHSATVLREEPWGVVLAVDFSQTLTSS